MELAKELDIDAILFALIETPEQVLEAEKALMEVNPNLTMMVMIETPLAILNSPEICRVSSKLEVVVVGSNKLANRLQIDIKRGSKAMFNYLQNCTICKSIR